MPKTIHNLKEKQMLKNKNNTTLYTFLKYCSLPEGKDRGARAFINKFNQDFKKLIIISLSEAPTLCIAGEQYFKKMELSI